jgi:hypothetical protein
VLSGFLVGATALGACTPSGSRDAAAVVADPAMQQLLQHIPADTPYAFVGMGNKAGGSTREFINRAYAPLQKLMPLFEAKLATAGDLGLPPDQASLVRAIVDEVKDKLSADGLAALGIDIDGRFAFYGLGVLPALRLQLRDPAALRAAIDRVQSKSGVRFPTGKLGDVEYWRVSDPKIEAAIAIVGDQLVAGIAPPAQKDRVFALLLGTERPERHLGNSEGFRQMLAEYSLARLSAGFVDARVIAEAFLGEGDALNKDILAALAPEVAARWPALDDTCKQEIRSLVALAPRMVFGTEQMDADGFAGKFVVELRRDIAQELMAMRTPVPGLDIESARSAVFAMGFGLDTGRLRTFIESKVAAVQSAPYRCAALTELNTIAGKMPGEMKAEDPELWKIKGFAAVVDDLKFTGIVPTEIRGFMSVAFSDTKTLALKAAEISKQPVHDDGNVVALPDGTIPFLNSVHYGIQPGRGGVIAVGTDSQARTRSLLAFPESADPPLMLMVYDMGRLAEVMKQVMGSMVIDQPDKALFMDLYQSMGAITYDAHATDRGVVINTRMILR